MAGRVDDHAPARGRAKPDLRRLDGDVLVAFRLQTVHQERPLERHAALVTGGLDRLVLPVGQRPGVVHQPPDEGGLAVIDVADDHDLEKFGTHGAAAYMYPSRRRRSKASSLS